MKIHPGQLLVLVALSGALFSMPLHAESNNFLTVKSLFTQMDTDKDGVIKPNEVNKQSLLSNEFKLVDSNSDGALDQSEFEIFIAKANI